MIERRRLDRRLVLLGAGVLLAGAPACAAPSTLAIKVYKDASCGCCGAWVDHLDRAGFKTEVDESVNVSDLKRRFGVPDELASCHTGVVNGYVIEGHVPAADIKRLVAARPAAKGLAVPGMPINSPGMEVPDEPNERYTVWLFQADGRRTAFAQHGG